MHVYCTHQVPSDSESHRVHTYRGALQFYCWTLAWLRTMIEYWRKEFLYFFLLLSPTYDLHRYYTIVQAIITCTTHYNLFRFGWLRKFILCNKRKIQSTKPSLILQHHGTDSNYTGQNTRAPSYPLILPWQNYTTHHPSQHYPLETRYNSPWVNKHPRWYHGKNTNIHLNLFLNIANIPSSLY